MNGRIQPYNVPPAFVWRDEASSTAMLALWHWSGYGKLTDPGAALRLRAPPHPSRRSGRAPPGLPVGQHSFREARNASSRPAALPGVPQSVREFRKASARLPGGPEILR